MARPTRPGMTLSGQIGGRTVKEAEVIRCKNGAAVNFMEDDMRRRDPNCMVIGDDLPTDKPTYKERFGTDFAPVRQETLDWLSTQQVILLPFRAGDRRYGYESLMICPGNAAFFASALANMQGFISVLDIACSSHLNPARSSMLHRRSVTRILTASRLLSTIAARTCTRSLPIISTPAPRPRRASSPSCWISANRQEGWVCCHASAAKVETPYESETVFMHEGASGGGKSEMLEDPHREDDGRILIGAHRAQRRAVLYDTERNVENLPHCRRYGPCLQQIPGPGGR